VTSIAGYPYSICIELDAPLADASELGAHTTDAMMPWRHNMARDECIPKPTASQAEATSAPGMVEHKQIGRISTTSAGNATLSHVITPKKPTGSVASIMAEVDDGSGGEDGGSKKTFKRNR